MATFFMVCKEMRRLLNMTKGGHSKALLRETRGWGYEEGCPESQRKSLPVCTDEVETIRRQPVTDRRRNLFWRQADFGYVKDRMDNMWTFCRGSRKTDSSLKCTDALSFCRGRNVYLPNAKLATRDRYRDDILLNNTFGGHCDLDKAGLDAAMTLPQINKRPLASWMREMEHFTSLPTQPLATGECDVIIERPTIFIKMEEEYNIFHHTCVFMNLYISLHVNNSFSNDVNILVWDTSLFDLRGYMTEMRDAFTRHDVMLLNHLDGKRVCFKDAIFSLPARMMLGIYYILAPIIHNTDLFIGLHGAGLTYMLYLPDWATVFEMNTRPPSGQCYVRKNDNQSEFAYRCGIDDMYPDLARMRGINYITWENLETLIPENKTVLPNYTNYSFDVGEFLRLVRVAADQVTSHPDLIKARHHKYREKGEL